MACGMSAGPVPPADRRESRAAFALFLALGVFHFWGATVGWKSLNLPGAEFRESQTAISAYYIQQNHDFSLAYPTPVLGKPWSVPMEFPLYQWTVVGLSNATGLDLTMAGRTVSLACFYLTLPAIFLLLGRLGLARPQRWLALGFVLTCPLYIFFARAFLIETMALMFSAWFLVAFLRAVEQRSASGLLGANLFGAAAGLVKVTTFMLFLLPAGLAAGLALWSVRPRPAVPGWKPVAGVAGWITAGVLAPFAVTLAWLRFADATKQLNPSAQFLMSGNLTDFNFGTAASRFSSETLHAHWQHLATAAVWPPVLVIVALAAGTLSRRWWRPLLLCLGCYVAALVIFPVLYAVHDYYGVANVVFLLAALGFALAGLGESRLPRWATALVVLAVMAGQIGLYLRTYYPGQKQISPGVSGLTSALREITDRDDVLVIAGEDWSSVTPYFAQRRALMIRNGQQDRIEALQAAFAKLADENVGAVVLSGSLREHHHLLRRLVGAFHVDPRPLFTWRGSDVYVPVETRIQSIRRLQARSFDGVVLAADAVLPKAGALVGEWRTWDALTPAQRDPFAGMSPKPTGFYSTLGPAVDWRANEPWYNAHPTTRLRFDVAAGSHRLRTTVVLPEATYASTDPANPPTDGVEIRVIVREGETKRRLLYARLLDPAKNPGDRGVQTIDLPFELTHAAQLDLCFGPGPQGNDRYDWISLGRVTIE